MASLATIDENVAEVVAITSVLLVLLSFIVIVSYHTYCVLHNTGVGRKVILFVKNRYYHKDNETDAPELSNISESSNITEYHRFTESSIISESSNVTRNSFVIQRESIIFDTSL